MEKAWCIVFKIPALVQALSAARVGPVLMTGGGLAGRFAGCTLDGSVQPDVVLLGWMIFRTLFGCKCCRFDCPRHWTFIGRLRICPGCNIPLAGSWLNCCGMIGGRYFLPIWLSPVYIYF